MRDSCGSSGTGETPQGFTPRRLTARPAESEHLEGKSTTPHYLVNSNKVCENSLYFLVASLADITFCTNFLSFLYPILSKVNAKYNHRNFYFYIPV